MPRADAFAIFYGSSYRTLTFDEGHADRLCTQLHGEKLRLQFHPDDAARAAELLERHLRVDAATRPPALPPGNRGAGDA